MPSWGGSGRYLGMVRMMSRSRVVRSQTRRSRCLTYPPERHTTSSTKCGSMLETTRALSSILEAYGIDNKRWVPRGAELWHHPNPDNEDNGDPETRPVVWSQKFSAELISCFGKRNLIETCLFILHWHSFWCPPLLAIELCNDKVWNLLSEVLRAVIEG